MNRILPLLTIAVIALCSLGAASKQKPSPTAADKAKADYMYLEAQHAKAIGNTDAMYSLLSRAHSLNPADDEIAAETGMLIISLSRGDSAQIAKGAEMLRRYTDLHPADYFAALRYALLCERIDQPQEALRIWNSLHTLFPEKPEISLKFAEELAKTDTLPNLQRAIQIYDSLETTEGKSIPLSSKKIQIWYQQADTAAILNELQRLLNASPSSAEYHVFAGDVNSLFQINDSALSHYNRACALDPTSGLAYYSRANYYNSVGDSAAYDREVFEALHRESLDVDTKLAIIRSYIQEIYTDSVQQPRITELFDALLLQHPHEHDIHDFFARYLITTGDYARGAEQTQLTLDLDPNDLDGWLMLSSLYLQTDQTDKALQAARRSQRYFPDNAETLLLIGSILSQEHQPRQGLDSIQKALTLADKSDLKLLSRIYTSLGDNYYQLHNTDSAFTFYDKAILYNPDNMLALNNAAYHMACNGGDLDKAYQMISKVIQNNPDNDTSMDTYAWVLFKKKEYSLARDAIDKTLQLTKTPSAELLEHAGDIYFMDGQPEQALKFWTQALKLDPSNQLLRKKVTHKTYFYE